MPLRKLSIEIELPKSATGQEAKTEHTRLLKAITSLVENKAWSAFSMPLHDSRGNLVGKAILHGGETVTLPVIRKEIPIGNRQPAAARTG